MSKCGESQKWATIQKTPHFFADLEWCTGAQNLWDLITSLPTSSPPKILSATPGGKLGKRVDKDKRLWCKKHLSGKTEVITCLSEQKGTFSKRGNVLIDDSLKHKGGWEQNGGVFIHHSDLDRTVWLLKQLFKDEELCDGLSSASASVTSRCLSDTPYSVEPEYIILVEGSVNSDRFASAVEARPALAGIDVEWCPDELAKSSKRSSAAVVQVALSDGMNYILDWTNATEQTRFAMTDLLCDTSVLKVGYGFAPDLERMSLSCGAQPVLDLQAAAQVIFDKAGQKVSLSSLAAEVLGRKLIKGVGKLSHQDWESRPLPTEMIQYAACDAAVLLDLYETLANESSGVIKEALWALQHEVSRPAQTCSSTIQHRRKGDVAHPEAVPLSASIYLDDTSRRALLAVCPQKHKQLHADHVTLLYKPMRQQVTNLRVGSQVDFEVTSEHFDCSCQAVRVRILEDVGVNLPKESIPHVTISTLQGLAVDSLRLLADEDCESQTLKCPLKLRGTVGMRVTLQIQSDPLGCLEQKVKHRVIDLVESGHTGEVVKLKNLSSAERHALHSYAEEHALVSRSEGVGDARKLILTKTSRQIDNGLEGASAEGRVVANAADLDQVAGNKKSKFKAQTLTLLDRSSFKLWLTGKQQCSQHEGFDGRLCGSQIEWIQEPKSRIAQLLQQEHPVPLSTPLLVILRGVPGSGKSHLASLLVSKCPAGTAQVCSADVFFEKGAGVYSNRAMKDMSPEEVYKATFSREKLPEAHRFCQTQCEEAITSGEVSLIVVDNTNTQKRDYQFYEQIAMESGWDTEVVEIVVPKERLSELQNKHSVPPKAVALMHQRLAEELEERALRLGTFLPKAVSVDCLVDRWLMKHGCIHFNKGQACTHLRMAVGDRPPAFINVPCSINQEFLALCATEKSGMYFCEYATKVFNLYLDIDFVGKAALSETQLQKLAQTLQDSVCTLYPELDSQALGVLVTGCEPTLGEDGNEAVKTGVHLKMPRLCVEEEQALAIRDILIRRLHDQTIADPEFWDPQAPWDEIVDASVTCQHRTLRMLFSRKASNKFVDVGRVYRLLMCVDQAGHIDEDRLDYYQQHRVELLQQASIRTDKKATPGYRYQG